MEWQLLPTSIRAFGNEELASLARRHNDANIVCIPARFISVDLAEKILDTFLKTSFEGGRHARRVAKIAC
jgi:ribose 5-phosphate isomerase B